MGLKFGHARVISEIWLHKNHPVKSVNHDQTFQNRFVPLEKPFNYTMPSYDVHIWNNIGEITK